MTRESLQEAAASAVLDYNTIILEWATGIGKSKAAINIMDTLQQNIPDRNIDVLFIVAETAHKENWNKEFEIFKKTNPNITMECYASLKKYKNTKWDLLILDEVHHINSDIRMNIFNSLICEKVVGLSATIPPYLIFAIDTIRRSFGFTEMYHSKVGLEEAIELEILPTPKIYLVPLQLNNTTNNCLVVEAWGKEALRKTKRCMYKDRWTYLKNRKLYPNLTLEIICTEFQKYSYLSDKYSYWKRETFRTNNPAVRNKWLQIGSQRKRFLGDYKLPYILPLLENIKDKRFICFCSSIEQAEALSNGNCIHSKKKDSTSVINNFNNQKINNIFAVGMLQEGQNLNNIDLGIIIQLDGQSRSFIQKFGRSLRAKNPIQIIFYHEGTRDEEYLETALENVNSKYLFKVSNVKDIIL